MKIDIGTTRLRIEELSSQVELPLSQAERFHSRHHAQRLLVEVDAAAAGRRARISPEFGTK
jgi:hypothetical protein